MQGTRHIPAVPQCLFSCTGDGLAHPHPLCSARKKAERPLDQRWDNRHGQEFLDHEMWLDGVERAAEVNEEDSCVCLETQGLSFPKYLISFVLMVISTQKLR